jgi:hypothetical protein
MEFLRNFAEKIESINKTRDPSEFNDDIANRTDWKPFSKTSLVAPTMYKLVEEISRGLRYKPAAGFYFLTGIFILAGMSASGIILDEGKRLFDQNVLFPSLFCLICAGLFIRLRRHIFFDQMERCMIWEQERTYYSDIHALQLVMDRRGENTHYQINLVLHDATRVFVMNYSNEESARQDAKRIAAAISIPPSRIWDMLPGYHQ